MAAAAMPSSLRNVTVDHALGMSCIAEGLPGRDFDVLSVKEVFLIKPPEPSFEGACDVKRPLFSRWIFPPEVGMIMSKEPVDLSLIKIERRVRFSVTMDIKSITMEDLKICKEDSDFFYSIENIVIVEDPSAVLKTTEIDSFISLGYVMDNKWATKSCNIALTDEFGRKVILSLNPILEPHRRESNWMCFL